MTDQKIPKTCYFEVLPLWHETTLNNLALKSLVIFPELNTSLKHISSCWAVQIINSKEYCVV